MCKCRRFARVNTARPGLAARGNGLSVRTRTHKLIHYYEIDEWELFDLVADPDELTSVYGDPELEDIQSRLEVQLDSLRSHYAVPEEDPVPYVQWPPGG